MFLFMNKKGKEVTVCMEGEEKSIKNSVSREERREERGTAWVERGRGGRGVFRREEEREGTPLVEKRRERRRAFS